MNKNNRVGIIGFGEMGSFFAKILSPYCIISAYDPQKLKLDVNYGFKFNPKSLKETINNSYLFLFPPISQFQLCCQNIRKYLNKETVIIECCSVMWYPVEIMKKELPSFVDIVGCHPLFGPQSGKNGVHGMKIALAPVRIDNKKEEFLMNLFNKIGLDIIIVTPEEHDEIMAKTQFIESLIGKVLKEINIQKQKFSTPGFELLLKLNELLKDDSDEILKGIQIFNPFVSNIEREIKEVLRRNCVDE